MNTIIASKIIGKRYNEVSSNENLKEFQASLSNAILSDHFELNFDGLPENLSLVLDYLRKTHAYYENVCFPEVEQQLLSIIRDGGLHGLIALKALEDFKIFSDEMLFHMHEEEKYFFPYAESLFIGIRNKQVNTVDFKHEQKKEHLIIRDIRVMIASMIERDNDFSVFSIVCNKLIWLERDIQLHTNVEEEVLIPIMLKMEGEKRGC